MAAVDDVLVIVEKGMVASKSEIQTLRRKIKILVDEIERLRNEINKSHFQQIPNGDEIEDLKRLFNKRDNYCGQREKKLNGFVYIVRQSQQGCNSGYIYGSLSFVQPKERISSTRQTGNIRHVLLLV